ncbi:hypothetical protein Tco_0696939 [Tanacetum coccineum]
MKDKMVYKGDNVVGALMNVPIFVGTFSVVTDFAVLEDMDAYRDERMGDVIVGELFLREVGIKARRFDGMITVYNGDDEVTYQIVRSHPRFKHHTNEQCNKIAPLLKVSEHDKMNGISHSYQKLKRFYKGVLNLGPDFIRVPSMEEWLTRGHVSVHEMECCLVGVVLLVKDCRMINLIMEYLVNISKRRAFWSLNEDILKITILKTNTLYPSRKIRRIRACTHQSHKGIKLNTPLVSGAKVIVNQVMAISTILISSDSSEESVGTSSGQVLWFGRIPTTVPATTPTMTPPTTHIDTILTPTKIPTVSPILPPSPNYTPTSPDYSPASDMKPDPSEDPSLDHIPPLPATSPFPSSIDSSSDNDTPDTPPLPTHEIPPVEPIPHGRPYRYHPNGPVHMMTMRKRVGPLPIHRLAVRHSVDYSSSDYLTSDDSSRDSPSDSSSEMQLNSSFDALSDSSSVSSIPHSSAAITERASHSSHAGPSRKRSRSSTTSVPLSSPIHGALSFVCVDLLLPPKRIRSPKTVTNLKDCSDESFDSSVPRETSSRADIEVGGSDEPHSEPDIDPKIQAEIDECIANTDDLRSERIDVRVVVETVAREEPAQEEGAVEVTYETLGDLVQRFHDHTVEIPVHRVHVNESIQRDQGHKIVASSQHEALEARNAARNLETLVEGGSEQEDENGDDYAGGNKGGNENGRVNVNKGNGNRGNRNGRVNGNGNGGGNGNGNDNGNGNGNRGGNGFNFGGFMHVARVYTYQDFLKCQPLNFNGTEGVVGLTCWFEKMETVFHISNSPQKYQVKYATCTLLNSALTWWNSPMRTIGVDVAYDIKWTKLMKLMKENDLTAYTRRFQELVLLCTRMVLDEEDKVKRFIGGLPDNIQGNVITAEPTRLQDAIRIANNLMDQKLKGYARSAENKRKFDNNSRDNHGQQPTFK